MKNIGLYTSIVMFGTLFSNSANALIAFELAATDIDGDPSVYNYEIQTNCFGNCLDTLGGVPIPDLYYTNKFYLPYFSDAGITDINSPSGWSYSIEGTNDLFGLGSGAGVIHWSASTGAELALYDVLSGFSYVSSVAGSVKAPFRLDYINGDWRLGDPPIPASPLALAAGLAPIPVPAAVWLFGSGLLGLIGVARRNSANL